MKKMKRTTEQEIVAVHSGGDIHVVGWDKDSIQVEIRVKYKDNADESIERVKPQITQSKSQIKVSVEWEEPSQSWLSGWISKNVYDLNKSKVTILYQIYMPKDLDLSIQNEFGDVIIEQWHGKLNILQEHGSIIMNGNTKIISGDLKFVDARFGYVEDINLDLKQVDLKLDKVDKIVLNSTGGDIEIDQAGNFSIQSARDKIDIEKVANCVIKSNFSDIQIVELGGSSNFEILFGSLEIKGFQNSLVPLTIDQRSSSVSVFVGEKAFEFKGEIDGGTLRLPLNTEILSSNNIDSNGKQKSIHAKYGIGKSDIIYLKSKNGDVIFKNQ